MTKTIDLRQIYKPNPGPQTEAHIASEMYVLYGGAVGGGKSVWLCNEGIQLSLECKGNVGYLCRHELSSFMRSTMMTLDKYLPSDIVAQHHQTENYIRLVNGSLIFYGGLGDDQKAIDRLNTMDLGWFGIDQAEETTEKHFYLLASRLRLAADNVRYKGLLTANPSPGWVKNRFIEQKLEDHVFIPALTKDNPKLPADYESRLRKLYPEELVRQLLEGDWEVVEAGNYLFKYADIKAAIERKFEEKNNAKILGLDIARFGDDATVICVRQGSKILWLQQWVRIDTMETAGNTMAIIERIKPSVVKVDSTGIGAGVADRLRELKVNAKDVDFGGSAKENDRYENIRAEEYWNLAKRFQDGEISIPDDGELIAQLSSIKYKFASDGRFMIEKKEDMKKRGIKSPDKADAVMLAFMEGAGKQPGIRWI